MGVRDPDTEQTPLHVAALHGCPDVVRMLLRRGTDGAAEDRNKSNAAFLARKSGHHECRQILEQHARERITSLAGQTVQVSLS